PLWLLKHSLIRSKNSCYLKEKIKSLSKDSNIIVSSFPLPKFMLKKMGFYSGEEVSNSYMFYTSFFPRWLKPFYKLYYRFFILGKKDSYFALGLLDTGIFKDEPIYNSEKELEDDMKFLLKHGIKKAVIFRTGALENGWITIIKNYQA
ncbi:MAG: hypothetical protein ABIB71_01790, partial [Candidatus Woesearchaeota archaeon]